MSRSNSNPTLAEYVIVVCSMSALGMMAVPRPPAAPAAVSAVDPQQLDREQALVRSLEDYRAALQRYRAHHAVFPGYEPGREGGYVHGEISQSAFQSQLTQYTNAWGWAAPGGVDGYALRPCLEYGMPTNPINGRKSVRMLSDQQDFPAEADEATGWVYKPSTGELRANTRATVSATGLACWEL